ncbi:protein SAWADEE HOMEODOMAIN HOMOLOG 2 isoform X1 [Zea mays]|uniref:Putative homeodomain-like transcription factor superfamily protein n=1 Tax=Zea mays TaxID=4577 RepID=K7V900_MAIZE|nr:protein SAWADEE HOMEODOMAIN HOMOLOG 2 isoform X1 [Zea mays]AQL03550.1 Putative homeodomain-like transcription factor superfamily protein [Zea mays]AQL03551.1 Putative homeodomain-like transcription factor superfamily protein [Zea mays]|eukprot:XP_008659540.1 protein SAWADEE HOMEODOMAIN HOMOLOG 2 isoform X1 [Zea mays]
MDRRQSSSSGMMEGPFRFLPAEVKEMEERLFPVTNRRLDHILMDELALKFSCFRRRAGMVPVKPKQVLNWFYNNRNKTSAKVAAREAHAPWEFWANHQQARARGGSSISKLKPKKATTHAGSSSGNNYIDVYHTKFEAKSARDGSWYLVEEFLTEKFCESGDLQVLVRFPGFGVEEAEWIDVRTCTLRQRSVPYKATECADVHIWDPVLCYKVSEQSGLYFDAEVHAIERKTHNSGEECDCKILVLYVHDNSEDIVSLKKLRRRYVEYDYKPQTSYELPKGTKIA